VSALFVITRLDPADDALEAEAEARGFAVVRESLLATEPGVDAPSLSERLLGLGDGTAIAWTSRRAGDELARAIHTKEKKKLEGVPLYALGEETAAPLRRVGFTPLTPESLGASELARFIADRAASDGVHRVLFLHGNRSLPDLPDGLKARGLEVEFLEVYRTRFLAADLGGLQVAIEEGSPIMAAFFSPSGVEALERFLTPDARDRFRERARIIARGPTTARALESRGYPNVFVPGREVPFSRFALEALQTHSGGLR
jgi:uroporphyrinogen-III synthase